MARQAEWTSAPASEHGAGPPPGNLKRKQGPARGPFHCHVCRICSAMQETDAMFNDSMRSFGSTRGCFGVTA